MKINSGFFFLSLALIACFLIILAPNMARADSYCPNATSPTTCSACCHDPNGTCKAGNTGGGTWDGASCTCFGCAGSNTCQQECQAQGCQGASGEALPCDCIGCPGGGDCWVAGSNGTDQAAGDRFCTTPPKNCTRANITYSNGVPVSCNCQGCNDTPVGDCAGQPTPEAALAYCRDEKQCTGANWQSTTLCNCSGCPTPPPSNGTITIGPPYNATGPQNINELIANITNWVLGIAGAIAVLFIILAGLRYITAHGDSKQTEAAKTALRNAIIGLVIVVLAFFIVQLIVTVLTNQP